jgi:hypothetical protein
LLAAVVFRKIEVDLCKMRDQLLIALEMLKKFWPRGQLLQFVLVITLTQRAENLDVVDSDLRRKVFQIHLSLRSVPRPGCPHRKSSVSGTYNTGIPHSTLDCSWIN